MFAKRKIWEKKRWRQLLQVLRWRLLHVLSHVNIVWGIGQLETEFTLSPEQAVIDDEMAAQLLRAQKGIEVSPETLALDVIRESVTSGDFLGHDHTLEHFRQEQIAGDLTASKSRERWLAEGGLGLVDRAARKANEILAQPKAPTVTPEQSARLHAIEKKWLDKLT